MEDFLFGDLPFFISIILSKVLRTDVLQAFYNLHNAILHFPG